MMTKPLFTSNDIIECNRLVEFWLVFFNATVDFWPSKNEETGTFDIQFAYNDGEFDNIETFSFSSENAGVAARSSALDEITHKEWLDGKAC